MFFKRSINTCARTIDESCETCIKKQVWGGGCVFMALSSEGGADGRLCPPSLSASNNTHTSKTVFPLR